MKKEVKNIILNLLLAALFSFSIYSVKNIFLLKNHKKLITTNTKKFYKKQFSEIKYTIKVEKSIRKIASDMLERNDFYLLTDGSLKDTINYSAYIEKIYQYRLDINKSIGELSALNPINKEFDYLNFNETKDDMITYLKNENQHLYNLEKYPTKIYEIANTASKMTRILTKLVENEKEREIKKSEHLKQFKEYIIELKKIEEKLILYYISSVFSVIFFIGSIFYAFYKKRTKKRHR